MGNEHSGSYSRCSEENIPGVECRREARATKTTLGPLCYVWVWEQSDVVNVGLTQPGGGSDWPQCHIIVTHTQPIHISLSVLMHIHRETIQCQEMWRPVISVAIPINATKTLYWHQITSHACILFWKRILATVEQILLCIELRCFYPSLNGNVYIDKVKHKCH